MYISLVCRYIHALFFVFYVAKDQCTQYAFGCDSKCIKLRALCDGVADCEDGTDEICGE